MAETLLISISVGVPDEGTPSVYRVKVRKQDSAGYVEVPLDDSQKVILFRALNSFMGALLE